MFINALTIDVEDWFHPELVREHTDSNRIEKRASEATLPILELLNRYGVKATFFILGEVAIESPKLVRQIYEEGHEIGCHGMSHRMLQDLGEEGLREELALFNSTMIEILGNVEIRGFRAPTFSLNQETKWALPILGEYGYVYDMSIFPTKFPLNPLYGVKNAPRFPYRISFDDPGKENLDSPFWEFPATLLQVAGFRIPVSGGVYLRTFPLSFFKWALKRINREGPFSVYLHPWECDKNTPRPQLPLLSRWGTYYGTDGMFNKLEGLLKAFHFSRVDEVLKAYIQKR